jgi:hypothetical protein
MQREVGNARENVEDRNYSDLKVLKFSAIKYASSVHL